MGLRQAHPGSSRVGPASARLRRDGALRPRTEAWRRPPARAYRYGVEGLNSLGPVRARGTRFERRFKATTGQGTWSTGRNDRPGSGGVRLDRDDAVLDGVLNQPGAAPD